MRKKLLLLLIILTHNLYSYAQYSVADIPSPKVKGQKYWVSDPDHNLSAATVMELDSILQHIDESTQAEFAVVVVNNFEGADIFEFALAVFNTWGIGKKETNNGLLLFVAKDRRSYRFVTGYGMEAMLPDAYLKRVGETYLAPNFRKSDYDKGF